MELLVTQVYSGCISKFKVIKKFADDFQVIFVATAP
jgi:hypothetical protein